LLDKNGNVLYNVLIRQQYRNGNAFKKGGLEMPIISRFYGMVIKMYFRQSEHNPPHIHVLYGDHNGVIDIQTGQQIEGDLPKRSLRMAQEWTEEHKAELMQIWNTQNFRELPPLD
jgi:hypothetical protein